MKKQTLLLSALALSIGLSLSVLPPAAASLPTQVPGQGALPSLAPMLEKVLPAVVSVQVEGTASPTLNMPEELKKIFLAITPRRSRRSRLKGSAPALSSTRRKAMC